MPCAQLIEMINNGNAAAAERFWLSHLLPFSGSYLGVLDLAGLAASIAAAAVLYRWVEKPAQEMSSRLRFTSSQRRPVELAAAAAAE